MLQFCKKYHIQVIAYGVLAGGLLSRGYMGTRMPGVGHAFDTASLNKYYVNIAHFGQRLLGTQRSEVMNASQNHQELLERGWERFQKLLEVKFCKYNHHENDKFVRGHSCVATFISLLCEAHFPSDVHVSSWMACLGSGADHSQT